MRFLSIGVLLCLVKSIANGQSIDSSKLIAIDILIEPDRAMVEHAKVINRQLLRDFPQGYELDSSHMPHITLAQRFVRIKDLSALESAMNKLLTDDKGFLPTQLTAVGYEWSKWAGAGILVCTLERTPTLLAFEKKIVQTAEPFAMSGGTEDAFARAASEKIDQDTVNWVQNFVPDHSGDKYAPHITLGIAHPNYLKGLKAAPFEEFSFKGVNMAIYQLGNFGTAQKRLWTWK